MKNVILISVDDMLNVTLFRDVFGAKIQTPNIDRLMDMGVTFENAYTPVPLCGPARAAAMTGKSPFATGVHHNTGLRIEDAVAPSETLFGAMHDSGFYTAARGKTFHSQGTAGVEALIGSALDEMHSGGGYGGNGETILGGQYGDSPVPESETLDVVTAEWAGEFLRDYALDDPFFLAVGFSKPHVSWDVPARFYDLYDVADIDVSVLAGLALDDVPAFAQTFLTMGEKIHEQIIEADIWEKMIVAYLAAISYADAQVGKVLDALDDAGLWATSTVILWSDHGYHLGDRENWHKFTLWEEAANVPLVIVDPDVGRGGERISEPVSLLDLWPTISGLTGAAGPVDGDGVDLTPLLMGETTDLDRAGVLTTAYGSISITDGDWRYTLYSSGEEELYRVKGGAVYGDDLSGKRWTGERLDAMREMLADELDSQYGVNLADARETGSTGDDIFTVIDGGKALGFAGDDIYFVAGRGAVVEKAGKGYDKVYVSSVDPTFKLFANVEAAELVKYARASVIGNNGHNDIIGNDLANALRGRAGKDHILGEAGDDRIHGGSGRDTLDGGAGADRLTGGWGEDTFVFARGYGRDVVRDFQVGIDRLEIDPAAVESATQHGDHVRIDLGGGDALTILNVDLDAIWL